MPNPSMRLLLAGLLLALSAPATADLSPREQRLASAIESREADAVRLLQALVDVNSGTLNFEGVREVGRMVDAELIDLGFETRWIDGEPFDRAGFAVLVGAITALLGSIFGGTEGFGNTRSCEATLYK